MIDLLSREIFTGNSIPQQMIKIQREMIRARINFGRRIIPAKEDNPPPAPKSQGLSNQINFSIDF
jgi:hypothetical protein